MRKKGSQCTKTERGDVAKRARNSQERGKTGENMKKRLKIVGALVTQDRGQVRT